MPLKAQAQHSAFEGLSLQGAVEERALAWREPRPAGLPHEPPTGLPYQLPMGLPHELMAGLHEPRTACVGRERRE